MIGTDHQVRRFQQAVRKALLVATVQRPGEAVENYAKAIYALQRRESSVVTTNALAERLGVTAASASGMVKKLDVLGLSVLSGSHLSVVPEVVDGLRAAGLEDVPVVVGGIIPETDAATLLRAGVARVFTPKDFEITDVLGQIVDAIEEARA